jgi:hypothetical protein
LMGVHDDKRIEGFTLSRAQQQHIVQSIVDTFNRFTPPVPKHFYDITFIEIVDGKEPKEPLMKTLQLPPVNLQHQLRNRRPLLVRPSSQRSSKFLYGFSRTKMDRQTYHKEKKSVGQVHQPLSSISNMGRSGTQTVYNGNRKRLLQDERHHKENSVKDIENFNKVVETLLKKNPAYKLLDPRKHLLKQYKDPLDFLTEDRRKKKIVYIFFANIETTNIFVAISTPKNDLQGISNRRRKRKFDWEIFFLAIRRVKKREEIVNSQLGAYHQKNGSAWKSTLEENEFSPTTTASKGPHDY